jgi:hypothetical protein
MVRTAFLLPLLLLVACGSEESGAPGDACKADLSCGGDLVCNFQAATPICLDADLDEDGDGMANKVDLCPATAGGSNHDEDGDKQGDSCDLCPIEAARGIVKDDDGDKLGGGCDPDDKSPGDKVVFFDGFGTDTLANWKLDDATHFSVSNDLLKVTVSAADPEASAVHSLPAIAETTTSFVGFRVVDAAPAGVDGASRDVATTLFSDIPMGGSRARCGSNLTSQASALRLTTDQGDVNEPFPGLFELGRTYRLLLQTSGGQAACVQTLGPVAKSAVGSVSSDFKTAVSVVQRSVAADYEYVLVVQSPPR